MHQRLRELMAGIRPNLKGCHVVVQPTPSKRQRKFFIDADDALVGEIVRQFNECDTSSLKSFTLGIKLQELLQRCSAQSYVDKRNVHGFCDGREWIRKDKPSTVWCHAGRDRPDGGRNKCESLSFPINAKDPSKAAQKACPRATTTLMQIYVV